MLWCDIIFNRQDIETFLACRLVCKDWKPTANTYKWKGIKMTPLVKAVKMNQELVAHLLIANGANISAQNVKRIEKVTSWVCLTSWVCCDLLSLFWQSNVVKYILFFNQKKNVTPGKIMSLHWAVRNGPSQKIHRRCQCFDKGRPDLLTPCGFHRVHCKCQDID